MADIHNNTCHICAKGCLDSNFDLAVIDKMSNFLKIAPNFTFLQNSSFLSIIIIFWTYCFYPINFIVGTCSSEASPICQEGQSE